MSDMNVLALIKDTQDTILKKVSGIEESMKTIPWRVGLLEKIVYGAIGIILVAVIGSILYSSGIKSSKASTNTEIVEIR